VNALEDGLEAFDSSSRAVEVDFVHDRWFLGGEHAADQGAMCLDALGVVDTNEISCPIGVVVVRLDDRHGFVVDCEFVESVFDVADCVK